VTGDQPWLGTLDRIAVYDRAFNPLQAYRVHQGLGPGDGVPASYDFRWVE
jgi:hypothetical protein